MESLLDVVAQTRRAVADRPLLALALTNAGTACVGFVLYANSHGGVLKVLKRYLFVAAVGTLKTVASGVVDAEQEKIHKKTRDHFLGAIQGERYRVLPDTGMPKDKLIKFMHEESAKETQWRDARVSGMVYHNGADVHEVIVESFRAFLTSNPLHPGVFPAVRKMEAEVVQMCVELFHGGPDACGTMTSGGTESNMMAIKAYRDWALATKNISDPELIKPATAHASFDKACEFLGVRCIEIPVDPVTFKVDVKAVEKAVTRRTIAIVGSAVVFSQGVMDDIEALAKIALKHGIGMHVDNCLGSLLLPFLPAAGFALPPFDFAVEGVTSLSADTHKYGYAPKGSSVIMYASKQLRTHQFSVYPDWMGSIYATPGIAGSRPGALIAATWGVMMYMGKAGYTAWAKKIMQVAKDIEEGIRAMPEVVLQGEPVSSVVCFTSADPAASIYNISDAMSKRGWELSLMQFPAGLHICVTQIHTHPDAASRFLQDLKDSVHHVKTAKPGEFKDGVGAIYGMAEQIPDRTMVNDIAVGYLDTLYTA